MCLSDCADSKGRGQKAGGRRGFNTKLQSNVVDRGDKGDKGDKGEKILSTNATSYQTVPLIQATEKSSLGA